MKIFKFQKSWVSNLREFEKKEKKKRAREQFTGVHKLFNCLRFLCHAFKSTSIRELFARVYKKVNSKP